MTVPIVDLRFLSLAFSLIIPLLCFQASAQEQVVELDTSMFNGQGSLRLADQPGWIFKKGHDPAWADPELNTDDWDTLSVGDISIEMADENGKLEGWLRIKIRVDSIFAALPPQYQQRAWAATDIYLDGQLLNSFGNTGINGAEYSEYERRIYKTHSLPLAAGAEHVLAIHFVDTKSPYSNHLRSEINDVYRGLFNITEPEFIEKAQQNKSEIVSLSGIILGALLIMSILFWLIYFQNLTVTHILFISLTISIYTCLFLVMRLSQEDGYSFVQQRILDTTPLFVIWILFASIPVSISSVFKKKVPKLLWIYAGILLTLGVYDAFSPGNSLNGWPLGTSIAIDGLICAYYMVRFRAELKGPKWSIAIGFILTLMAVLSLTIGVSLGVTNQVYAAITILMIFLAIPLSLLIYISLWLRKMIRDTGEQAKRLVEAANEKKKILAEQNVLLEKKVDERTRELSNSLEKLKETQDQLIHSEKMASLGELTAGIAHEIQNPLNFVNNFSEVNTELSQEMEEEIENGNLEEAKELARDIRENEAKILHHGKRAEEIVRSMLQHSRGTEGTKELTDINSLVDEYLRLAYHGMRAKDKSFNAELNTEFEEGLGSMEVIPQDLGRVVLNLITNSFHAVMSKKKELGSDFNPLVSVSTRKDGENLVIKVEDNGKGISEEHREKIFQPFFTTKATGEGTGLGLSLSYDIITKGHGGTLTVTSEPGEGAAFVISLPLKV